ncbi:MULTISPECIES: putative mucin/carbohydrate-binding domain-containing protein [unclassified Enterococcus]|uniref:putative mucin/carbohydrate-binding domain-containing protein n=1 Tax=unclassified Enterococcus TaxID=2608891 RepID=UPI001A9AA965|nr:LPXTG cell wall anchor domain-containing protein [Enterococcus sp. DIV1271a]
MSIRRKIIHSVLVGGMLLGNLNGVIVQGVSVTNTNQTEETKQIKEVETQKKKKTQTQESETQSTKDSKQNTKTKKTEQSSESKTAKKVVAVANNPKDNIPSGINPITDLAYIQMANERGKTIQEDLKNSSIDFSKSKVEIGEEVVLEGFSYSVVYVQAIMMDALNTQGSGEYWASVESESGNWEMKLSAKRTDTIQGELTATFKRLKYSSSDREEIFRFPRIYYSVLMTLVGTFEYTFEKQMPTAESIIGKLEASVKDGSHTLMQEAKVPSPEMFVKVENSRGNINYEWSTAPDTSKVGDQTAKAIVSDETGRKAEIQVPITVTPLPVEIKAKPGPFDIYQYDLMPDAEDYFEITNKYGTYNVEWINNANTNLAGTQSWQAKVTTSDGREATASVPMEVKPHEGLKVNLKPIEDRSLGYSYPTFESNFRDYIDSVTMHGDTVELRDLEFIPEESVEADYRIGGTQLLKLTVQTKHPNSGVMIKGTGEVTLNVLWDHSILMKSINGESAGSFSLRTDNSGKETAKIVFGMGIPTSTNTAVGPQTSPFSLYYSFEVLRGETVVYSQEVTNRATWQQIMDKFGDSTGTIDVRYDDVIKIYHPERTPSSSVLIIDEKEQDYTYDTPYAYYKITPYGFDPFPVLEAEASQKSFVLGENTKTIDPASLLKNVKINGRVIDSSLYEVESLIDFDTSSIGTRKMKLKVTMNDGLSAEEFEVDYQVKWGSTFVLKGLNDATVGAFSLLKENDQWALHASQGVSGTDLSQPVNNHFGRDTYYGIEVIENITTKFQYKVLGNQSIEEAINGFNQGQPLPVKEGDVIKVYHAEPTGNNLLMKDELAKDYTMGSNDAYYEVTAHGLEPIIAISTDTKSQEFTLGDDATGIDGAQLINQVTINGTELTPDLYTVKQLGNFDTTTVGQKELEIQFDTKDGVISKVITVPYEVKWGRTIVMKSSSGGSAGVFSLQTNNTTRQLRIHHGFDSPLDERLSTDSALYYSIEVLRGERVQYSQEVPGRVTLQEVIDNFGNGTQAVNVQIDDIIKIYHPQKSAGSSVLMVDELEEDFTYGSDYAYYRVTTYGFEALPVMEVHGANKAFYLAEDVTDALDADLLDRVTINGKTVDPEEYTIERRSEIDTTTVGEKTVSMRVRMNDGLSSVQLDVPYQVKWGSTFVLKGEEKDGTRGIVGSFTLLNQNDELTIYATKGQEETELNAPVNTAFGRNTYYRIDILADPKNKTNPLFPDNIKCTYEVAGNQTVRQAIQGFNNGQPLAVEEGDIFRVYHAETENQNLLMWDDIVKNYTAGLNYAYYEVKNGEFEPITMIHADVSSQELVLGEDASEVDVTALVENVAFNGQSLNTELYKVEQIESFDTRTTGEKTVSVKVSTADGVSSTDIEVPYEVKWGSTIHLKNRKGETVGSFGLVKKDKKIEIQSVQGTDRTVLKNRVTEYDDTEVYYGIELLNERKQSKYQYEVRGTQTIEQAIARFNTGSPLAVTVGDIVKVYHVDTSNNLLMAEETERNYTYGSNFAYYKVTDYGFEPTGELTVESAQVSIAQGAERVDLKSLVKEVKVNGRAVPKNFYTVSLDPTSEIDTETMGSRFVSIDVKVDRSYGSLSTRTESTYEIVEPSQEATPQEDDPNAEEGADGQGTGDSTNDSGTLGDASGEGLGEAAGAAGDESKLPQTNQTINRFLPYIGICLLAMVGLVLWKRKTANKN